MSVVCGPECESRLVSPPSDIRGTKVLLLSSSWAFFRRRKKNFPICNPAVFIKSVFEVRTTYFLLLCELESRRNLLGPIRPLKLLKCTSNLLRRNLHRISQQSGGALWKGWKVEKMTSQRVTPAAASRGTKSDTPRKKVRSRLGLLVLLVLLWAPNEVQGFDSFICFFPPVFFLITPSTNRCCSALATLLSFRSGAIWWQPPLFMFWFEMHDLLMERQKKKPPLMSPWWICRDCQFN